MPSFSATTGGADAPRAALCAIASDAVSVATTMSATTTNRRTSMAADPLSTTQDVVRECTAAYANVMAARRAADDRAGAGRALFLAGRGDVRIEARADLSQLAGA